jgi:hypothetical protein
LSDVNQILGSSGDGLYAPRAMAMVRGLMSRYGMIPTFIDFLAIADSAIADQDCINC